jgi:hypothetical protein
MKAFSNENKSQTFSSLWTGYFLFWLEKFNYIKFWCDLNVIRLFRIMSIPTTFRLFLVLTSEQIGRRLPVFTLLIKLFYSHQRLQYRDKYFFKIKFVFFLYLRLSASSKDSSGVFIFVCHYIYFLSFFKLRLLITPLCIFKAFIKTF